MRNRSVVHRTLPAVVLALTATSGPARAQSRAEVGFLLGSSRTTNEGAVLEFDRGATYQATFACRLWRVAAVDVSVEVPFIATPAFSVKAADRSLPLELDTLYLTPGLRFTGIVSQSVFLFGAIGGGYARYSESVLKADRSPNPNQRDTNTGALQFGGGVDVQGGGWLGVRGEIRDVYTGARNFSLATPGSRVHNVVASVGLVAHF